VDGRWIQSRRWEAFSLLQPLYKYRQFIWRHAFTDVRHRYAGTGMGLVWNVLHPLSMIAIYSIVFTTLYDRALAGVTGKFAYTLYLCAGFFPWMAFSECISRGCMVFSANSAYLKKLPVPEQVFVAQTASAATLGLAMNFVLLLIVSLAVGLPPNWHWLLLPLPLLLLQTAGFGLGMICGTLNVFFPDTAQIVTVVLQLLFWMSPIVYMRDQVNDRLWPVVASHPVTPAIKCVRDLFLYGQMPPNWVWPAMAAWAIGSSLVGYFLLQALRPDIRDLL
jgi:ABC-type polysaccharide/polyol phosphate export permease